MSRSLLRLALMAALAGPATGCAVLMLGEGGHAGGTGTLSDAAARASADSTTRFKGDPPDVGYTVPPATRPVPEPEPEHVVAAPESRETQSLSPGAAAAGPATKVPEKKYPYFIGLVAGGGALGGREYDGLRAVGVTAGGYSQPRVSVDGTFTVHRVTFREQAYLYEAFRSPEELNFDLTGRLYLTRAHTFMGLYALAGAGTGTLRWDFANPVTVLEDGVPKSLDGDQINYFSFYGGAGMSLVQTRYVHGGVNLAGGVRFYGRHTGSGLENDMLRTTGYVKVLFELCFRVAML